MWAALSGCGSGGSLSSLLAMLTFLSTSSHPNSCEARRCIFGAVELKASLASRSRLIRIVQAWEDTNPSYDIGDHRITACALLKDPMRARLKSPWFNSVML